MLEMMDGSGGSLAATADVSGPADALVPAINVARAWQAAGSVYAILGEREAARAWYRRALDEWQRLENLKGFPAPSRQEADDAAHALGVWR